MIKTSRLKTKKELEKEYTQSTEKQSHSTEPRNARTGMFFSQNIIFTMIAEIKDNDSWSKTVVKLTSDVIDQIPIATISKIKIYQGDKKAHILKICSTVKTVFYKIPQNEIPILFSKIIWCRLAILNIYSRMGKHEEKDAKILEGTVMKRGEVNGMWDKRYMRLSSKKGIQSFKTKESKTAFVISETKEIWTRFDLIDNNYLIFKLWYGIVKQEIGIAVEEAVMWAQQLTKLVNIKL